MYGFKDQDDKEFFNWREMRRVTIGHDTWIGHGSIIMPDVKIGNGAVIGSQSVVTKDVASYEMVAGSPAKRIRFRFSQKIAEALEELAWWDWPYSVIKERFEDFKDLRRFLWKYGHKTVPQFSSEEASYLQEKFNTTLTSL
jgi:hypothetical protein